ncbi:MAG: hypothetical protein KJ698_06565 [Actinobacteria bacterium]|nr:hypothetical protein [Actinomycetota bacterium]
MYKRFGSLVLLLAMTAAACGSEASDVGLASLDGSTGSDVGAASLDGSDGNAATDDTVAAMDSEEAMLAFTQCLRDQGLDVADPELGEDGQMRLGGLFRPSDENSFDREAIEAAMDACSEYRDLITTGFGEVDRTAMEDQIYEYAACMRENGYEMADPDFSDTGAGGEGEGGQRMGPFGDIDRSDPAFQAANEVCQDLFGGFGPGGGLPGGGLGGGIPPGDGA